MKCNFEISKVSKTGGVEGMLTLDCNVKAVNMSKQDITELLTVIKFAIKQQSMIPSKVTSTILE